MPGNTYRDYMKACMLKKNLKGKSGEEVRRGLTECAEAWSRAVQLRLPEPFDEQALAEQYVRRH